MENASPDTAVVDRTCIAGGRQPGWSLLGLLTLLVLLAWVYAPILPALVSEWWNDSNYSHGFLVPLFSGFLVWRQREAWQTLPGRGSWWGLGLLLFGLGLLVLGQVGAEHFLSRSSLIAVIAGLVWLHLGGSALRSVGVPLGFLFFMIPLPAIVFYAMAFPLQGLAAQNAAFALDRLGVPVLLEGNVIHLSDLSLGVTEACSGIRSLMSLVTLALAWGYLTLAAPWALILFVASAVPITIVANAARVVMTGLIGQWFGRVYAEGFFHTLSGWLIFVFAFLGFLVVHRVIRCLSNLGGSR
jgi:exosortase